MCGADEELYRASSLSFHAGMLEVEVYKHPDVGMQSRVVRPTHVDCKPRGSEISVGEYQGSYGSYCVGYLPDYSLQAAVAGAMGCRHGLDEDDNGKSSLAFPSGHAPVLIGTDESSPLASQRHMHVIAGIDVEPSLA
jgi:hypothetical protein